MTQKGVWDLQQVRDEYLQGNWGYSGGAYQLWSFGANYHGRLGLNNTLQYSSPTQIPGNQWSTLSAGYRNSFALKNDNTLWSWGYNAGTSGQLGQNNLTYYSSPVQIPGTRWNSINSSNYHSLATKTDGTLWSWGYNGGQLGLNEAASRSSPHQIPGTQWSFISGNGFRSLATKTDGTLWSWGRNQTGELGLNEGATVNRSSPHQIPGTQWSSIGKSFMGLNFALKSDGTLWTWGSGSQGQLGINSVVARSSPTQIPGTEWSNAESGGNHVIARKTDGTLWIWGHNQFGQLGIDEVNISRSSPHQVPGTQWNFTDIGRYQSLATKTDGTLWTWGYNSNGGRLGLNDTVNRSSPTQIPGTQWQDMSATGTSTIILKQA